MSYQKDLEKKYCNDKELQQKKKGKQEWFICFSVETWLTLMLIGSQQCRVVATSQEGLNHTPAIISLGRLKITTAWTSHLYYEYTAVLPYRAVVKMYKVMMMMMINFIYELCPILLQYNSVRRLHI